METTRFGKLNINPAQNPAILDTATWDERAAWSLLQKVADEHWTSIHQKLKQGLSGWKNQFVTVFPDSAAAYNGGTLLLSRLTDRQEVLVCLGGSGREGALGRPFQSKELSYGLTLSAYRTNAETLEKFFREIDSSRGPRALGSTPRLGIGCRLTTAIFPAIWSAMAKGGFVSNAIQNSVRELNLLSDLLQGKPPKVNYQFSFGSIQEGHTGSTFEGLWTAGVLDALKSKSAPTYGADADHVMVKRSPDGMARAKRVIESGRYYTFFTLDVGDILNYAALWANPSEAALYWEEDLTDAQTRNQILAYHREKRTLGGRDYGLDQFTIAFLVGKYWRALAALEELYRHIRSIKGEVPFDLELSIDENPPEFATCECLTEPEELIFLALEASRRGIPLTHIAPNFGIEKGVDYRCPDGLEGLESRMRQLCRIAEELDLMLDCHSGDDLSVRTRQVIGKASGGRIHFKVSPCLQVLFAEVLHQMYPKRFHFWWDDTLAWAKKEAEEGSGLAIQCLKDLESGEDPCPSPRHAIFRHFNFATLGKRDDRGQFIHREKFYTLPEDFYEEYKKRLENYLCQVADDIFGRQDQ